MAFSRKNALITPSPGGLGGLETRFPDTEELLQGVLDTTQTALQVVPSVGGSPVSAANPLPVTIDAPTPGPSIAATIVRGTVAPAATATPVALAAAGTYAQTVTIWGQRAARVANAANVYVDGVSGNGNQQVLLPPGSWITFTAPPGKVIDLSTIYVQSLTLTDGVFFLGLL